MCVTGMKYSRYFVLNTYCTMHTVCDFQFDCCCISRSPDKNRWAMKRMENICARGYFVSIYLPVKITMRTNKPEIILTPYSKQLLHKKQHLELCSSQLFYAAVVCLSKNITKANKKKCEWKIYWAFFYAIWNRSKYRRSILIVIPLFQLFSQNISNHFKSHTYGIYWIITLWQPVTATFL